MMQIEIEMLGPLKKYVKDSGQKARIEIAEGARITDLLAQLGVQKEEPWSASIEGKLVDQDHILEEGAHVLVFPPIAGGSVFTDVTEVKGDVYQWQKELRGKSLG